jgi:hypothetical protein
MERMVRLMRFTMHVVLLPVRLARALTVRTVQLSWAIVAGTFRAAFAVVAGTMRTGMAVGGGTFRAGMTVGAMPAKASRRVGRLLGVRALFALLLGVAIGLLFAPGPGRELRDRLRALLDQRGNLTDEDLAERVVFELEHAPRTWHLPQPSVSVVGGRVVLTGRVEGDPARDELGRVAAAMPGVVAVDNLIAVEGDEAVPS